MDQELNPTVNASNDSCTVGNSFQVQRHGNRYIVDDDGNIVGGNSSKPIGKIEWFTDGNDDGIEIVKANDAVYANNKRPRDESDITDITSSTRKSPLKSIKTAGDTTPTPETSHQKGTSPKAASANFSPSHQDGLPSDGQSVASSSKSIGYNDEFQTQDVGHPSGKTISSPKNSPPSLNSVSAIKKQLIRGKEDKRAMSENNTSEGL